VGRFEGVEGVQSVVLKHFHVEVLVMQRKAPHPNCEQQGRGPWGVLPHVHDICDLKSSADFARLQMTQIYVLLFTIFVITLSYRVLLMYSFLFVCLSIFSFTRGHQLGVGGVGGIGGIGECRLCLEQSCSHDDMSRICLSCGGQRVMWQWRWWLGVRGQTHTKKRGTARSSGHPIERFRISPSSVTQSPLSRLNYRLPIKSVKSTTSVSPFEIKLPTSCLKSSSSTVQISTHCNMNESGELIQNDMDSSHERESVVTPLATAIPRSYVVPMPKPGQPGASDLFDGKDITQYLEDWNMEADDYGLDDQAKCSHFPRYCIDKIKEVARLLPGYVARDWRQLQSEIRELYWQHDTPTNTTTALHRLIKESQAGSLDLNVYLLKFTTITDALVRKNALSDLDRIGHLLDGLSEDLRRKVLKYCTKQEWRLSSQDIGTADPDFALLKEFVLTEARSAQKSLVYERERAVREGKVQSQEPDIIAAATASPLAAIPAISTNPTTSTIPSAPSSTPAALDPVEQLSKRLERLTLALESRGVQDSQRPAPLNRVPRCVFCDSTEHTRGQCAELADAVRKNVVRFNEKNRVVSVASGEEIPSMFGKGGMKRLLNLATPAADVRVITYDDQNLAVLGEGSTRVTTYDFERGIRTDEIIDADVEEKRKKDDVERTRRVRSRINPPESASQPSLPFEQPVIPESSRPNPSLYGFPQPPVPDGSQPTNPVQDSETSRVSNPTNDLPSAKQKYRLASELNQTISTTGVGEKIMNTVVQLSIGEILAVSTDVSNYMHELTRRRRVPLPETQSTSESATATAITANVNEIYGAALKPYYALPSGRARVLLDDEVQVASLMDEGSELNVMPRRTFEKMSHPIDTKVDWRINSYDAEVKKELEEVDKRSGVIGVLHDVLVDIGGVCVKAHVFVVERCNVDLILGRPWARSARAQMTNEDDGTYTCLIKSPDGRRMVKFVVAPAEHGRNREYARNGIDPMHLKE
jgi:hypothetical protein